MTRIQLLRSFAAAAMTAGLIVAFSPAVSAQGVVGDWKTVEAPPPPDLKPFKVDVATTALMVMDFTKAACSAGGERVNPRCMAAMPKVKDMIDKARAHHMFILFTTGPTAAPNAPDAAASDTEQTITGPPNKFDGTSDLNKILKDHGITTVIAMGTAPNGAVLFTAYGLAVHGYKVVVPVDTMPGASPYAEASSIWGIGHDPTVANMSTLTSVDMISF